MRRKIALVMALLMVFLNAGGAQGRAEMPAAAETQAADAAAAPAEPAVPERPVSDTPTHVTVGNATQVSGYFFTDMWGHNTSDMDVRALLHGYNLVAWSSQVEFVADPMVVREVTSKTVKGSMVYTVSLQTDLTYCDGQTPITAKDYVFTLLLCTSPALAELGADSSRLAHIVGYDAYHAGETPALSGVRLIDDYTLSIAVKGDHEPFFYDLANISCSPYPIGVLAPGCDVADTKAGARLVNENANQPVVPFTAALLQDTVFNAETGYMYHPALTSGPYCLAGYNAATGQVDFQLNPYYKGNYEGVKPVIDTLTLLPANADTMVQQLRDGEFDLLNKCVDAKVILQGLELRGQGFSAANYARLGYGFCSFACEKGPQQFTAVRQAIAYCMDTETFVKQYLQDFGLPVYGYYGMGQWMALAAMGSLRPEGISAAESAKWDKLTLDGLNHYGPDTQKAKALLVKDGWTLNADGAKFVEGVDTVRYKKVGKERMRLSIRFAQTQGNEAAALIVQQLQSTLPALGVELTVDTVPFTQLLAQYYRQNGERSYDMCFMASNFLSVFDPYTTFGADGSVPGTANVSGLNDQKLAQLALKMHKTEPKDYLAFEKNWLAFQERFNEVLPTLPLYSNVYFDFHTDWLQNYAPNNYNSWPAAILYAYYAQPVDEGTASTEPQGDGVGDGGTDNGEIIIE